MGEAAPIEGDEESCSIARTLALIGDRWTLLILRNAFKGIRRFDDLRRDLGIAKPVLADRLKRLVDGGLLERRQYQDRPPRYEYRLTKMGLDLSPALIALMKWGDAWLAEDGPPTVLVHEPCGQPLDLQLICWTCDETLSPGAIRSRPGPGARPLDTAADTAAATAADSPVPHVHGRGARS